MKGSVGYDSALQKLKATEEETVFEFKLKYSNAAIPHTTKSADIKNIARSQYLNYIRHVCPLVYEARCYLQNRRGPTIGTCGLTFQRC